MNALCLMTDSLSSLSFERMVKTAQALGFEQLEIATGNWSSAPHLDVDLLLQSRDARQAYLGTLKEHRLVLAALNCSGNQLAPNALGAEHATVVEKTFALAPLLGVAKVVMMSGLPGAGSGDTHPNWITTSWPPENGVVLDYQWRHCLLPYWKQLVKRARDCQVDRIALENHGCQLVYNARTLKMLCSEIGPTVGMNLDPSHLFWMGGDPRAMARSLGPMIYHVHAKDVRFEAGLWEADGLLDTLGIEEFAQRSWNYVALGYGHDESWWKEFFSILVMVGYTGPVSLEMEDRTMDQLTGVLKSLDVLKAALPRRWQEIEEV